MTGGLQLKNTLFLLDFNQTWIFLDISSKNTQTPNSIEICRVVTELFHAGRRTDRHEETNRRWIKRDQLGVTCFIISLFNAQYVSDVSTSILRGLRLICWVISWVVLLWFNVCWCYAVVWLGWCGVRMQAEELVLTTPPQPNHSVTPKRIEPKQYNPWNNSTNKSQAPEDGCINIRNMSSIT